jgi:hypothetical protein
MSTQDFYRQTDYGATGDAIRKLAQRAVNMGTTAATGSSHRLEVPLDLVIPDVKERIFGNPDWTGKVSGRSISLKKRLERIRRFAMGGELFGEALSRAVGRSASIPQVAKIRKFEPSKNPSFWKHPYTTSKLWWHGRLLAPGQQRAVHMANVMDPQSGKKLRSDFVSQNRSFRRNVVGWGGGIPAVGTVATMGQAGIHEHRRKKRERDRKYASPGIKGMMIGGGVDLAANALGVAAELRHAKKKHMAMKDVVPGSLLNAGVSTLSGMTGGYLVGRLVGGKPVIAKTYSASVGDLYRERSNPKPYQMTDFRGEKENLAMIDEQAQQDELRKKELMDRQRAKIEAMKQRGMATPPVNDTQEAPNV